MWPKGSFTMTNCTERKYDVHDYNDTNELCSFDKVLAQQTEKVTLWQSHIIQGNIYKSNHEKRGKLASSPCSFSFRCGLFKAWRSLDLFSWTQITKQLLQWCIEVKWKTTSASLDILLLKHRDSLTWSTQISTPGCALDNLASTSAVVGSKSPRHIISGNF